MESSTLILAICRAFQLLFAVVVLGTSASLTNWIKPWADLCSENCDVLDTFVPRVEFGIFVGALGLLAAIAGLISTFTEIVPYLIQLGVDVLSGLSYVAGGAVLAAWLAKPFICEGDTGDKCTEIKADSAFNFLGFIITVVIIGLSFIWRGRRGGGSSYV